MSAHTPAPWVTDDHQPSDLYRYIFNGNGRCAPYIARLSLQHGDNPPQEQEANARLISASPDLLSTLKEVRRWIGDGQLSDWIEREYWTPEYAALVDRVDAVIKKAEGGPHG